MPSERLSTTSRPHRLLLGAFNTDPQPSNVVQWYDIADDRYIETRSEHIIVRPGSTQDLATRFLTWIEHALQRIREDEYETW
ncbi:hypothetical protein [Nocardia transvalensis]|uniref:hypothetical protein n=1 Tax=Nocardia transvalensis TaxID=37333 RepID=UPI0018956B95|nr:hypothetical protein [Nocardia transvalensis]MBF6332795.1 hypothetical protein [Nocardia transvalensis]